MPHIKGIDRNQQMVFPEVLDDYIPENSVVRIIDVFVNMLDLLLLGFKPAHVKGRPSYSANVLLKIYLYGYLNKIRSSRALEREAGRNLELIWLTGKLQPDHRTISRFREENSKAFKKVAGMFVVHCRQMDLFGKNTISVDGSKFRANNSKSRNYTSKTLKKRIQELEEKLEAYLKELDENDKKEEEEEKDGEGQLVSEIEDLPGKIEELEKRLSNYQDMLQEMESSGESQISLTDPDSRLMGGSGKAADVGYNVQTVVEEKSKMIVAHEVTNDVNDLQLLNQMATKGKEALGEEEVEVLADANYSNANELKESEENGIVPYVPAKAARVPASGIPKVGYRKEDFQYDEKADCYTCPQGNTLTKKKTREFVDKKNRKYLRYYYETSACHDCPVRKHCVNKGKKRVISRHEHEAFLERASARVKNNPEKYTLRWRLSEHPFGTLKKVWGFEQFYTRGLDNVSAEFSLSVLAYNIKRAITLKKDPAKLLEALEDLKKSGNYREDTIQKGLLPCPA